MALASFVGSDRADRAGEDLGTNGAGGRGRAAGRVEDSASACSTGVWRGHAPRFPQPSSEYAMNFRVCRCFDEPMAEGGNVLSRLCKARPYNKKWVAPDRQTFALPLYVGQRDRIVLHEDNGQHHSSVR